MLRVARLVSLVLLVGIALATLLPIGLRPQTGHATMERAGAFFLLGVALSLGFPRHVLGAVVFVAAAAVALELLQAIDPTRHARVFDGIVKIVGGVAGVLALPVLAQIHARLSAFRRARRE